MMRKNTKWTGLPTMVMALGLTAWTASDAQADPIITYSTAGTIDTTTGISGVGPAISYIPVTENTVNAPSALSLGSFQVAGLTGTQTTTYDNTPFKISFFVNSIGGATPDPNETPITISGVLNGTITGKNQSTVVAKFDTPTKSVFKTGAFSDTFKITDSPLSLVPSTTNSGLTSAQAHIKADPVSVTGPPPIGGTTQTPEPTSIALFGLAIGGLALHRYRSRRAA